MANETARRTNDQAWRGPDGPMSRKVFRAATEIKIIAQHTPNRADAEALIQQANALIRESERVAEMETTLPVLVICPVRGSHSIN